MQTYIIDVIETFCDEYDVEANSSEEAIAQVKEAYNNEDLDVDVPRYPDVKFVIYEPKVNNRFLVGVVEACDKGQNNWKVHNIFTQVHTIESLEKSLKEICQVLCKMPENAGKCFRYRLGEVILDSSHTCVPYCFENYPTD